jgi:polysaccharide export outer membrane protein/exopolysaccharide production protein ExoF
MIPDALPNRRSTGALSVCGALPRRWAGVAVAMAAAAVLIAAAPAGAADAPYRLGAQDKVRLKVYEWRAAKGDVFEWAALNGNFTVGAGGKLSLPLIGDVQAAGLYPQQVAATISDRLKARIGLLKAPDAAVEVVQYRPFYILGAVDHPGEFPYRPGLTVLQALGIAGGLRRTVETGVRQVEREIITGRGDLTVYEVETRGLLARRARLSAELAGAEDIAWPAQLKSLAADPGVSQLMSQEHLIFQTRREALKTQLQSLGQLRSFYASEIDSIAAQLKIEDRQLALIRTELKSVSSLREKGLVVAPRVLSLQRTEAEAEGDRLRMNTALLQAKQESGKTELTMLELKNNRHNEIVVSLRETQSKLDELAKRAGTTAALLQDSEDAVPQLLAEQGDHARQPTFTIIRRDGERTVALPGLEDTAVQPGDTIKVEMPRAPVIGSGKLAALRAPPDSGRAAAVPQN